MRAGTFAAVAAAAMSLGSSTAFAQPATTASSIRLREVSAAWGIDFRHHHGGSGERYMVETVVGGVVAFDYDDDGDADLFFVDGGTLPGYEGGPPRSRLFRNDGVVEGSPRFVDVTVASRIAVAGYGVGGAAADIEGDGDVDLYVTVFGPNLLFRNEGDGTFTEVGEASGAADPLWSTSAAFADTDRDGDLDLYVANYVDFALDNNKFCGDERRKLQGYCNPGAYEGLPDHFYGNRGDGTFEDATAAAGLSGAIEAALGVVFADFELDGWPDIFVANDADPSFLFRNKGDGTFEDISLLSGTAYSPEGRPEAGMGVEAADLDGDGLLDIAVTHFELETNGLWKNLGNGLFVDVRFASGFAEPSLLDLGFGVVGSDLDHDGDLDVLLANGHILDNAKEFNQNSRYGQRNEVMQNEGGGRFRELKDAGLTLERVSRGLAAADLDGDGDQDFAVVNSNDLCEVYENLGGATGGGWLLVDLVGAGKNTGAIGARLELVAGGGKPQVREVRTGASYLSQSDLTVHFGLGAAQRASLAVRWPDGREQRLSELPAGRRVRLWPPAGR